MMHKTYTGSPGRPDHGDAAGDRSLVIDTSYEYEYEHNLGQESSGNIATYILPVI